MFTDYLPVFLMLAVATIVALGMFALTSLVGPKKMTPEKAIPYESGSETTGAAHLRLSVKFFLTAILFVVFDIEAVFLYPWAGLFRHMGELPGLPPIWFGFLEMVLFLIVLGITLVYAWKKGALEWEK
ncbi:MAG: NADH-quinone oxidoreductase subunit A [Myxococcales bacterium]|nr:NADH-quinone oxidoreductase subunit A [Myxococcales bacterium]